MHTGWPHPYGVRGPLLDQAKDLLTDTSARVRWQGHRSEAFAVTWGVQQGSPASTAQWNLYVNLIVEQTLEALGQMRGSRSSSTSTATSTAPAAPDVAAFRARLRLHLLADDITIIASSLASLQRALI